MIAVALVPVLGAGRVGPAAALVGIAWISDFLDGKAARASETPTRLGRWDLPADTAVGAALILGSVAWGRLPAWLGFGVVIVLVTAFIATRNEALSMLLQAIAYALLLGQALVDDHLLAVGWLAAVIVAIGFANRRVFWERSLPTFLQGTVAVFRRRPSE